MDAANTQAVEDGVARAQRNRHHRGARRGIEMRGEGYECVIHKFFKILLQHFAVFHEGGEGDWFTTGSLPPTGSRHFPPAAAAALVFLFRNSIRADNHGMVAFVRLQSELLGRREAFSL